MAYDLQHTETRDGFEITLEFGPEDTLPYDFIANDADGQETCDRISDGSLMWFTARVAARKDGIVLGDDYLGACVYESEADFRACGYYADMVAIAIENARATLEKFAA